MRFGLGVFAFVASRPWLYRLGAPSGVRAMRLFNRGGWVRGMPGIGAWTAHRDFPAPAKRTFMAMLRDRRGGKAVSARDEILQAVRAGLGMRNVDAAQVRREAAGAAGRPALIRPILDRPICPTVFAARATHRRWPRRWTASAARPNCPTPCAATSTAHGLRPAIALQPAAELRALDWAGFELRASVAPDEAVGVGVARWGIAETGSLVFHSGAEMPILANFLPLHHVVPVHARHDRRPPRGLRCGGRRRAGAAQRGHHHRRQRHHRHRGQLGAGRARAEVPAYRDR